MSADRDLEYILRAIRGRVALRGETLVADVQRLVDEGLAAIAAWNTRAEPARSFFEVWSDYTRNPNTVNASIEVCRHFYAAGANASSSRPDTRLREAVEREPRAGLVAEARAYLEHPPHNFPRGVSLINRLATALQAEQINEPGPLDRGSFVGDIFFGDPVKTTLGTHRWNGSTWEKLPSDLEVVLELLAEARQQRDEARASLQAPRGDGELFAWLIEAPGPRYLGVREMPKMYGEFLWVSDANAALRFWSEEQADKTMLAIRRMEPSLFGFEVTLGNAWPRQHGWVS